MGMVVKKELAEGFYSSYLSYLWEITSEEVFPEEVIIPNSSWERYIDLIWNINGFQPPIKEVDPFLIPITDLVVNNVDVVIGFSGGKDSLACALKASEEGLRPTLYHVKGITRSNSYAEEQATKSIAVYKNFPMHIGKISYKGSTSRIESPVRNSLVLSYMIDYMVEHGITMAMLGTHLVERVGNENGYKVNISGNSDCLEVTQAFIEAIRGTFKQFRVLASVNNFETCCMWLFSKYPRESALASSCFMADRLKDYRRNLNINKFGIKELPKYFCLNCMKCCREYLCLYYAGLLGDMVAEDMEGVVSHCTEVLRNKLISLGENKKVVNSLSDKEVFCKFIQDYKYVEEFVEDSKSIEKYMKLYCIEPNEILLNI